MSEHFVGKRREVDATRSTSDAMRAAIEQIRAEREAKDAAK